MSNRIYILAGTYKQACFYSDMKGIHLNDWQYLAKPEQLRGIRNKLYCRCGTWYDKEDLYDIIDMLNEREMREIEIV